MYFSYKTGFNNLLILIRSIRISKVSLLIFCVCVLSLNVRNLFYSLPRPGAHKSLASGSPGQQNCVW